MLTCTCPPAPPEQQHVARQQPAQHAYGGLKDMHARVYVKLDVPPQELHRLGDVRLAVHELQGSRDAGRVEAERSCCWLGCW